MSNHEFSLTENTCGSVGDNSKVVLQESAEEDTVKKEASLVVHTPQADPSYELSHEKV
jgi:hypothetical protein